ncbi:MAG: Eco57I restriction-modification methylase domain-containing protein [Nitrospirae bacterium]|nr:Eco57I restriction-modification methylase domain-containing protein [Nitrospirota bacterium]
MIEWKIINKRLESLIADGSPEPLQRFFAEDLNYHPFNENIFPILTDRLRDGIKNLRIIARQDEFYIVLCRIESLLKGKERPLAEKVAEHYHHSLVIFTNTDYSEWHFTNIKYVRFEKEGFDRKIRPFRRIIAGRTERLRTASERLALIEVNDDDSALTVHEKCNRAFDVQEVSRDFYKDFVLYYKAFREEIKRTNRLNDNIADTITQNIFNRLFFLYYIQKKNFLSEDTAYLYGNFRNIDGEYYKDFLLPLFKKLSDPAFPASIDERFKGIPFLNGGLFEFELIEDSITIPNNVFKAVFEYLLERYNFTVREDTELEQEVAIDPEMLGTIFEQLVLSLEKAEFKDIPDARRQTGSYYTPKFIVAFMVKQALLNYLSESFQNSRKKLKELVFNLKTDELGEDELSGIKERLLDIKIVDPGVGSGAFPVGILLKIVEIVEAIDSIIAPLEINKEDYRYRLKRIIIENNIYGVDIQRRAVNLANLRLWLSLIVDLNVKNIKDIPPLPNLDYHVIEGDSLITKIGEIDFDMERAVRLDTKGTELMDRFIGLKKAYEDIPSKDKKDTHRLKIEKAKKDLFVWLLRRMVKDKDNELYNLTDGKLIRDVTLFTEQEEKAKERLQREIGIINEHINNVDSLISRFNWGLDFFEILEMRQGFDIVIGNPPYGVKVPESVKDEFGVGNKDSYGIFTALGLKILRPGGTLCYIMSDTWQTIRTHKPLRDKLLSDADCQYLISCPSDTFGATVNVGVYTFKRRSLLPSWDKGTRDENWILAADFSPLSIEKGELEAAFEILIEQNQLPSPLAGEGQGEGAAIDGHTIYSDRDMAIFAYKQKLITIFSNHSFFIASPKLFGLMRDVGNIKNTIRRTDEPPIYSVDFNGKELELIKLGDVTEVKKGIDTGENNHFLLKTQEEKGDIEIVNRKFILKPEEIAQLSRNEKLYGVDPLHFNGRYILPYDKGGSSDIDEGWLPNYYVETGFYVKWSQDHVKELRIRTGRMSGYHKATIRNEDYWFKRGITFSSTGIYAPTFRINSEALFDNKGSTCFCEFFDEKFLLGVLCSKVARLLFKVFIQHNVEFAVDALTWFPVATVLQNTEDRIKQLVSSIISKQKQDPRYDYMTNEQVEIDRLVYDMYNLNEADIKEVEDWFFRRYPKLARVIEVKMNAKNKKF